MLTAQFSDSLTTFYRTNRYITYSCFSSIEQVAQPENQKLWATLEQAFGQSTVFLRRPSLKLEPVYLRGNVLEVTNVVQVREIVSRHPGFSL